MDGLKGSNDVLPTGVIERHIQTILATIVTGLIFWGGVSLIDNKETMTRLEERFISMSDKVETVLTNIEKIHALEVRVKALEITCDRCERESNK